MDGTLSSGFLVTGCLHKEAEKDMEVLHNLLDYKVGSSPLSSGGGQGALYLTRSLGTRYPFLPGSPEDGTAEQLEKQVLHMSFFLWELWEIAFFFRFKMLCSGGWGKWRTKKNPSRLEKARLGSTRGRWEERSGRRS